jgi:hypothetical protein
MTSHGLEHLTLQHMICTGKKSINLFKKIDNFLRFPWQKSQTLVTNNVNASDRLTVIQINGSVGFVRCCELAHGAGKGTGDYCGQMKCDAFKNG